MFQELKQHYEEYQQLKQQQKDEAEAQQDLPASKRTPVTVATVVSTWVNGRSTAVCSRTVGDWTFVSVQERRGQR